MLHEDGGRINTENIQYFWVGWDTLDARRCLWGPPKCEVIIQRSKCRNDPRTRVSRMIQMRDIDASVVRCYFGANLVIPSSAHTSTLDPRPQPCICSQTPLILSVLLYDNQAKYTNCKSRNKLT
jgi:hypothetical protein